MSSNGTPEKADFVGGINWHVPQPNPAVSEGYQLRLDAHRGDKDSIRRCKALFGKIFKQPTKKKRAPKRAKPTKRRA